MAPFIKIGGRRIGPGDPIYIVAEMSANHDGRIGILLCSFQPLMPAPIENKIGASGLDGAELILCSLNFRVGAMKSAFGDFDDDGQFFRSKVGFEGGPIVGVAINAFC
jgi:hypothetical protein